MNAIKSLLLLIFVVGLAACGGSNSGSNVTGTNAQTAPTEPVKLHPNYK